MGEKYDQQDGAPNPRPDTDTARSDAAEADGATVGERETQGDMAGQGTGQMTGEEESSRAGREGDDRSE